ncbi:MAG TPA: BTAD domain-containing putative transcriptional regulator [Pseudonocardiaceae bacterium]|nr:BTAD domain-containing putative transcriptional regulator [Pseudonocardiaceae bacterium]
MSRVRLEFLGGFTLTIDGEIVEAPKTLQRLVAFLGLRQQATRAHAVGALWPEVSEDKALGSLRTALWRLQQLGAPVIATSGEKLSLAKDVVVDVNELAHATRLLRATEDDRRTAAGLLLDGPAELLPGWFEDWVLIERERLRQLCLHTLEELADHRLRAGRFGDAVDAALAAMRAEPLRESPYRLLIEIHIAEGNYSEAVRTYQSYRTLLDRELGVTPSPAIRALIRDLFGVRPVEARSLVLSG